MGILFIVATPIGNLEDITLRAINTLSNADVILAEDTRVTKILLGHYNIKKDIISYHQHSDERKIGQIVGLLREDKRLALVTDAGTPGINDPGNFLIKRIVEEIPDIKIVPIPGPNAAITALSVSGFPTDRFVYLGFPPHKKGRQKFFKEISKIKETVVFYESKYRILKALEELRKFSTLGERRVLVCRELTKQFETIYRGNLDEVETKLKGDNVLGEFVVVIEKSHGK